MLRAWSLERFCLFCFYSLENKVMSVAFFVFLMLKHSREVEMLLSKQREGKQAGPFPWSPRSNWILISVIESRRSSWMLPIWNVTINHSDQLWFQRETIAHAHAALAVCENNEVLNQLAWTALFARLGEGTGSTSYPGDICEGVSTPAVQGKREITKEICQP